VGNREVYFNPYDVGWCLGIDESGVRTALQTITAKQFVKLTNVTVQDMDSRKLHIIVKTSSPKAVSKS